MYARHLCPRNTLYLLKGLNNILGRTQLWTGYSEAVQWSSLSQVWEVWEA